MENVKKIIDKIVNNPDILYPADQFPGIILDSDDFISFRDFLELSRQETVKKYTTLRDIANSIIKKDGLLQGIAYSEYGNPNLTLLFRAKKPLGYQKRYNKIKEKTQEEVETEIIVDGFNNSKDKNPQTEVTQEYTDARDKLKTLGDQRTNGILNLEHELKDYQEKYKEHLDLIADYHSPIVVHTNKGAIVYANDEDQTYDESFAAYNITEDILDYLLNASNLTSDIEMEFVREYYEELTRYKEALESGVLYPDFAVTDYTGHFNIETNHTRLCIFKQENAINIPKKFGEITICLYNPSLWNDANFSLTYHANDDNYKIKSSLYPKETENMMERGFIHKALLPERYRNY